MLDSIKQMDAHVGRNEEGKGVQFPGRWITMIL